MINKFLVNFSKDKLTYSVYALGVTYCIFINKSFYDMVMKTKIDNINKLK
jgi:hypothetical protein